MSYAANPIAPHYANGEVLKHLMDRHVIGKSISAHRKKKHRTFDKYAKKFTFKKYKDIEIGERVQVDHMTVTKNGRTFKHLSTSLCLEWTHPYDVY